MAIRITQIPIETSIAPTDAKIRATQIVIETSITYVPLRLDDDSGVIPFRLLGPQVLNIPYWLRQFVNEDFTPIVLDDDPGFRPVVGNNTPANFRMLPNVNDDYSPRQPKIWISS